MCHDSQGKRGTPPPARGSRLCPVGAAGSRGGARAVSAASQMVILCTFSAAVFALYLAPLTISSPCIMEKKDLGPKPALIGHRGAPMVSALGVLTDRVRWGRRAAVLGGEKQRPASL